MSNLRIGALERLQIPLPPMAMQRRIAGILGALDDKIELNRRIRETLSSGVLTLYRDLIAGQRAEGAARSISDIADVVYGAAFSSREFNEESRGVPLLRIRDLKGNIPGVWTTERHPKGHLVNAGDIVVGMDGEFRASVWAGDPAWLNQRVCAFVPKKGVSAAFVLCAIQAPLAEVEATKTGTTVIHLGKSDIDQFRVPTPQPAALARFDRAAQPMLDRAVVARGEVRQLARIRDTLLPKLFAGELRAVEPSRGAA